MQIFLRNQQSISPLPLCTISLNPFYMLLWIKLQTNSLFPFVCLAAGRESSRVPVLVFIHGESFEWNAGNPYDGSVLASYGKVVVVTVNFRLGVLGMSFHIIYLPFIAFCIALQWILWIFIAFFILRKVIFSDHLRTEG